MYNFVRSYIKKDYQWALVDVSAMTLRDVIDSYDTVRLVVTWDTDVIPFIVETKDNASILSVVDKTLTVTDWLLSYTEKDLVAKENVKELRDVKGVRFTDLYEYPVSIDRANHQYADGLEIPTGSDVDLVIRNQLKLEDELGIYNLGKNSVLCVNGRLLETISAHGNVYGVGAVTEADTEDKYLLSIMDFTDVGGCDRVAIGEDNLTVKLRTMNNEQTYTTKVVVDVGMSMRGKTPVCALDGMFNYKNSVIRAISDTKVEITVRHDVAIKNASRRVHDKLPWIDPVTAREQGIDSLTFDVVKYLSANTSFIILINTDELCINEEAVGPTFIPGFYTHYRAPRGLLMAEDGRLMPYYVNDFNQDTVSLAVGDVTKRKKLTAEFNRFINENVYTQAVVTEHKEEVVEATMIDLYVF